MAPWSLLLPRVLADRTVLPLAAALAALRASGGESAPISKKKFTKKGRKTEGKKEGREEEEE